MGRHFSQITIAIVCVFLGFMLTYEFKLLNSDEDLISNNKYAKGSEISEELENVKKQREELKSKNNELAIQLRKYEESLINQEEINHQVEEELKNSKVLLGSTPIEGAGITVTLDPSGKSFVGESDIKYITDEDILYIINELKFAGAEAIAVNDKRITSQSGIKSMDNNSYILINEEKISPISKIEIKAIGDKVKLRSALEFADTIKMVVPHFYDTTISTQDLIKIPKYNKLYKSLYIRIKE
jgi:uncharacterized protein YlxW (UPF0749 family)